MGEEGVVNAPVTHESQILFLQLLLHAADVSVKQHCVAPPVFGADGIALAP